MNISTIKNLLSSDVSAKEVNQIIDFIEVQHFGQLTELEKASLRDIINSILLLSQDQSSGAYVNNRDKARSLLEALGRCE